jgi:SAM-dependent methyltransferase
MTPTWIQSILRNPGKSLRDGLERLRELLNDESDQTLLMLDIYRRSLTGNVSRRELKKANAQFADVLRLAGLGTFFVAVPGSMLLIPIVVKAGQKIGIRVLPDGFEYSSNTPSFDSPDAYLQWWTRQQKKRTAPVTVVVDDTTVEVHPGVFNPSIIETPAVQLLLQHVTDLDGKRVLDMGCGTGIVAIHAALAGATHVTAVDIDAIAVANARANVERHGLAPIIDVVQADLFAACTDQRFDLIIANLPISETVWPVKTPGLLQRFVQQVPDHLASDGHAVFVYASFGDVDGLGPVLRDHGWIQESEAKHFGVRWWLQTLSS